MQSTIHPTLAFYLSEWEKILITHGLKKQEQRISILGQFWNEWLTSDEQSAIIDLKQPKKIQEKIWQLLATIPLAHLAKQPSHIYHALYARIGGVPDTVLPDFERHYQYIKDWFTWEYESVISDDPKTLKQIIDRVEAFDIDEVDPREMMTLMLKVGSFEKSQPLMRAYQSLTNHAVYTFDSQVFSRSSYNIFRNFREFSPKKITGEERWKLITNTITAYDMLLWFFSWEQDYYDRYNQIHRDRMREWQASRNETIEDIKDMYTPIRYHPEYAPILRHICDWTMQAIPEIIYKLDPPRIAALALTTAHLFHSRVDKRAFSQDFVWIDQYLFRDYIDELRQKKTSWSHIDTTSRDAFKYIFQTMTPDITHDFFYPVNDDIDIDDALDDQWSRFHQQAQDC
jgi:hypothetical protein